MILFNIKKLLFTIKANVGSDAFSSMSQNMLTDLGFPDGSGSNSAWADADLPRKHQARLSPHCIYQQ